ncbi:glycosyltransferase [Dankookia rubra]|uniref:Glycosyltransferase n=1 Tax=Dankookia rubra TaxID=1442381 RepID=A0A4R5QM14_9PROT|nr:glycosyltransferase [Dankookia rubra]TDH64580.1 glycosyltransferase [Dankookia rubra]
MRLVYVAHSIESCWNHGNAHFLRGILAELQARGNDVTALAPAESWSLDNLLRDHGEAGLGAYRAAYPGLRARNYRNADDLVSAIDAADLVIVHEWTDPWVVAAIGRARRAGGRFRLLFHDTHHRAMSDPEAIRRFDLQDFDGVLAFGAALAAVYQQWGWDRRVFVWHEAADTRLFRPPAAEVSREGLVWIGNWGDDERSEELEHFLLRPTRDAGLALDIHGVRYPDAALGKLAALGARYRGWLPNARAPEIFARHLATVHVPRRFYVQMLPGIPTIRVFEALACGIPLLSAPWEDAEHLFRPGQDYLVARDEGEMLRHMRAIRADAGLRAALAASGLETIRARHTCAHRVDELLAILAQLRMPEEAGA